MPTSATSLYPTAYKELCFHPRLQPRTPSRVRPVMTVMGSDRHSWRCVTKHTAATFSVTFPHPVVPACCDVSPPVWVSLRSECMDLSFWTFPGGAWAKPLLALVYFFRRIFVFFVRICSLFLLTISQEYPSKLQCLWTMTAFGNSF